MRFSLRGHFELVCDGDVGVSKSDQLRRLLSSTVELSTLVAAPGPAP